VSSRGPWRWSTFGGVAIVFAAVAWLSGCVADPPPEMGTAVAEDGRVTVTWSPPAGDAGKTVSGYVVTPYIGSDPQPPSSFGPAQLSGIVTGLTNGVTYTFTVHAINAQGAESARSAASNAATPEPGLATAVSTGLRHSCALIEDGGVRCWGLGQHGQLGNGTLTSSSVPVPVTGITDAVAVAAGGALSCAVLSTGEVPCWGIGSGLGRGFGVPDSSVPLVVPGIVDAVDVSIGGGHVCVVRSGGGAKCWGGNSYGQLGNGNTGSLNTPVNVVGLTDAIEVSAGYTHTCAVRAGGAVLCWGDNEYGQLSSAGIANATEVSSGELHSCAVLADGAARCWGAFGFTINGPTPLLFYNDELTQVSPVTDVVDVMANTQLTCAVQSDGDLLCGGSQAEGLAVFSMPAYANVSDISMSPASGTNDGHFCVVLTTGGLRCQGNNSNGQLGNGSTTSSEDPVVVVGY
jgi:alpha-tubulin suppressor-like RCC1 family protein